jgi:5-hydroxyisourate hydrolase-like protein (transthyretin family)
VAPQSPINNEPAANVKVSLRAGMTKNSLKLVKTTRTGSDGRWSMEIEKGFLLEVAGRYAAAGSGESVRVYVRARTSFAKSTVKSLDMGLIELV